MRRLLPFLSALARYCAAVGGATALALLLLPLIGYSPYGDRPPAGWYPLGAIDVSAYLQHVRFVGEFAFVLLLPGLALYFVLAAWLVTLIDRCSTSTDKVPRVGRLVARVVILGASSFLGIAGAAWYISMGWLPLLAGMLGSVAYSVWCMPSAAAARARAQAI